VKILGPREKDALPYILAVLAAFLFALAFLAISVWIGM
jgi:hypothetical protein